MKRNLLIVGSIVWYMLLASCNSGTKTETSTLGTTEGSENSTGSPLDSTKFAAIKFNEDEFSFGDVEQGQVLTHTFAFTNTGKSNLLIQNAVASCGCTVPQWPKEAIAPGEKGNITVEFNSKNITGQVKKTVTITANTLPPTTQVAFTCNISEKAQ
ncbi:MAG: DUF1573 domain-containing protein [Cytophagales bacterium]|nr:DUF1573 domain-containing protein [Cytophagales bacterium]